MFARGSKTTTNGSRPPRTGAVRHFPTVTTVSGMDRVGIPFVVSTGAPVVPRRPCSNSTCVFVATPTRRSVTHSPHAFPLLFYTFPTHSTLRPITSSQQQLCPASTRFRHDSIVCDFFPQTFHSIARSKPEKKLKKKIQSLSSHFEKPLRDDMKTIRSVNR